MGKYFDERLTDQEGYLLIGEDIFDILDIFETRNEATEFIASKYGKSIEKSITCGRKRVGSII